MTEAEQKELAVFSDVLLGVATYKESHSSSLTQEQLNSLTEIQHRLERLDNQFSRLMDLNKTLTDVNLTFDPSTDTATIHVGGIAQSYKLRRADPNVPIALVQSTFQTVYQAGGIVPPHQIAKKLLRLEMEGLLESYYHSAHRVLKLIKTLPQLRKFDCPEINRTRNNLVEHAKSTEPYSFGYGSYGPVVRPVHTPGPEWIDAGLLPNSKAFITALRKAFPLELAKVPLQRPVL